MKEPNTVNELYIAGKNRVREAYCNECFDFTEGCENNFCVSRTAWISGYIQALEDIKEKSE